MLLFFPLSAFVLLRDLSQKSEWINHYHVSQKVFLMKFRKPSRMRGATEMR